MVFGSSFLLLNHIQNKPTNGAKNMMKNAPPELLTPLGSKPSKSLLRLLAAKILSEPPDCS